MLDKVEIKIKAGDGGDGIVAFHREKFVPMGGPSGGDGGNGGDVIIQAAPGLDTLRVFKRKRFFRAADGENGSGSRKHGKRGVDLVITVPPGTMVALKTSGAIIADLVEPGQQVVIARGGKGGWGNARFASPSNQAPRIAHKGEPGEEKSIVLELKLIADVGIIGFPNVGKSSLLAAASAARPEIADYPFTTREPVLGVVNVGGKSFVLAEIPGLIEDAHLGRGLGHDFLRHAARTRVFIHLLDGTSASPVEDMLKVNTELGLFDPALAQKPQLLAVNKIDLPEVRARVPEIKDAFSGIDGGARFISAATGEGVPELMSEALKMSEAAAARLKREEAKPPLKVFRPQPREMRTAVHKEGDAFVIDNPELARFAGRTDITDPLVRQQLRRQLDQRGVTRALEKAGVKPGDKVRCGNLEWEWE